VLAIASRVAALCAIAVIGGCASPGDPPATPLPSPAPIDARADALERSADVYAGLGQRDLAAPLYARAIEIRAASAGRRVPEARALAALAVIQHDRDHLPEALHFYQRALDAGAEDDPELRIRVLFNLGSLLRASDDPQAALAHLERARELRGGDNAPLTPELAALLGESAAAHAALGHTDEAIDRYEQALATWELHRPESEPLVAETLANLGLLHRARGEHARARARFARALPLYEQRLAADDPTLRRVRQLLAASAKPAPRHEPVREADPADIARDLDRDGAALLDRRDYARARPLLERAVAIHERGVTAPVELGASLSYLGRAYAGLGEREAARRTLARALALLEPALGKLDPLTLATRASLENVRGWAPADAP
jgi:tetratricopeptide (TPR) repeat protein